LRVDARYCSTRCRQAAHRAVIRRSELDVTAAPMRFAYADPPYPGNAAIYRGHRDYAGEVDHDELLSRLPAYDGWALSTSARALPGVLALAVARSLPVRVAVWTRSPRPHKTTRVVNAWEPVIYSGGRRSRGAESNGEGTRGRGGTTSMGVSVACVDATTDVLSGVTPRRRSTHPGWLVGSKPPRFCAWVFDLLGAGVHPGDELDDLYPGSGIVARSWALRVAWSGEATADVSRVDGGYG